MRKPTLTMIVACAIIFLSLASCNKIYDYLHPPKGGSGNLGLCNIAVIKYQPYDCAGIDSAQIVYNIYGDPLSIIQTCVTEGHPYYDFTYETHKGKYRIDGLKGVYNNNSVGIWHRFTYDNRNRIITDSTYTSPDRNYPKPQPELDNKYYVIFVDHVSYDSQDRVVKVDREQIADFIADLSVPYNGATHIITTYTYNAQGNLSQISNNNGDVTKYTKYDNKINFNLTHSIWRFLSKDYSLNNHFNVTNYNMYGLPLKFAGKQNVSFIADYGYNQITDIEYQCK